MSPATFTPVMKILAKKDKVAAIVVTYHPDLGTLVRLLNALATQVAAIVIVDNGSGNALPKLLQERNKPDEYFLSLGANFGIAVAQNKGIEWARSRDVEFILLFDQDSEPDGGMVLRLLEVAEEKIASGVLLAAVGPRYIDSRQDNPPPFIKVKGLRVERQVCTFNNTVVEVDYLIASGSLIPVKALDIVGDMRGEFFIDYVDIEWGLRAKLHGLRSFGVCGAVMRHDLGDEPINFFGKKVPLHSPLRHYYHFRNAVWMYRQRWLPLNWKFADGGRLILKYVFYALFATPRWTHFKMMTLGVWHGLRGSMGRFDG